MFYTPTGESAFDTLYCSEEQWKQAKLYYANSDNFIYYCGNIAYPDIDVVKFDELMEFAKQNGYKPFGSNSNIKTCRIPTPDTSSEIFFYK